MDSTPAAETAIIPASARASLSAIHAILDPESGCRSTGAPVPDRYPDAAARARHAKAMPVTTTRVLLLSGASLVGQNIVASLAGRRDGLELVATGSVADDPALFDFDRVHLAPETASETEAFRTRAEDIIARERPALVIPCRDDDVNFLGALRDRRPDLASALLCGGRASARIICDKWRSAAFCTEHGLPGAPSIAGATEDELAAFAAAHGFPLVAKPRAGFASRGVLMVTTHAQLVRAAARDGYMIQKFLGDGSEVAAYLRDTEANGVPLFHSFEGTKRSIQAMIAPDGSIAGVIGTRHDMRQGRSVRVAIDDDGELRELGTRCARLFSDRGWRGPLNVQCRTTPDGRTFIWEFSGRFTGATSARTLLGYDEVGIALRLFAGHALPGARAAGALPTDVVQVPASCAVDPAHVAALMRDGVWHRP